MLGRLHTRPPRPTQGRPRRGHARNLHPRPIRRRSNCHRHSDHHTPGAPPGPPRRCDHPPPGRHRAPRLSSLAGRMPVQEGRPMSAATTAAAQAEPYTLTDCAHLLVIQDAQIGRALTDLITTAERTIFIVQYQFRAPFNPKPAMKTILDELMAAADRGLDIR